jgi:hypothetical protein
MKLLLTLLFIALFSFAAFAQEDFGGRSLDGIKGDYKAVGAVVHVKITKITLAGKGVHSLYAVESELVEAFKGKIKKTAPFTFYFDAEEDYNAQQLVGKEWVVFLEKERPTPNGGKAWYELENSKSPASEKLSAELRKLKKTKKAY